MTPAPIEDSYDLVIIGASFAGLVCARTAAMRGLRVAVIDGKTDPGARVHSTGILAKETLDEFDIPADLSRKVRGIRLYAPNLKSVDLFAPGYFFLSTDTANLLRWLAQEAQAVGAKMFFGERFSSATQDRHFIHLTNPSIRTRYLVGADGVHSQVARVFKLATNKKFLAGVEWEYEGVEGLDGRFLHCFIDQKMSPGYLAWAVPGVHGTQIGHAARLPAEPNLDDVLRRISPLFKLSRRKLVGRRSGLIPIGGRIHPFAGPRVLLIGDAAGWVSPLTGGGIRLAFQYGRRAAQVISDYLSDYGAEPGVALARELPNFHTKTLLRFAFEHFTPNWLIDRALMTPPVLALARRIYFHRRGSHGSHFDHYTENVVGDRKLNRLP